MICRSCHQSYDEWWGISDNKYADERYKDLCWLCAFKLWSDITWETRRLSPSEIGQGIRDLIDLLRSRGEWTDDDDETAVL